MACRETKNRSESPVRPDVRPICAPLAGLLRDTQRSSRGFSVVELLTAFAITTIVTGFVVYGFRELDRPAENAALQTMGFLKKARAKALATTWAYTLTPSADGKSVTSTYGKNCSAATQTNDSKLTLAMPAGAHFLSTAWSICFSTRGLTDSSATIYIQDSEGLTKRVELAAGGGTRIL